MSKIRTGFKYWMQIFLLPIYFISFLVPRNKKVWLYGSTFGKRFADNPKYFYLYMSQHHKEDIRSIWISRDREIVRKLKEKHYEAYFIKSFKGFFYSLIGAVYLYDNYTKDISFWLSGRAMKVNLWHGIPLKKINMDNLYDKVRHPRNKVEKVKYALRRISDERPSHYVLTTSKLLTNIFSSAFDTDNVIVAGYPRNDVLISDIIKKEITSLDGTIQWIEEKKSEGSQIIIYMPTFRDSETSLFKTVRFNELNDFLNKHDMILCVKAHPKSIINNTLKQMQNNHKFSNVKVIDANVDPYELISFADQLITDYSSIYFDYLLLNRPIIFFPYDYNLYIEHSREFYFDYDKFTPGRKAYSMSELEAALLEKDTYEKERIEIRNKVFEHPEEMSSEILYKIIAKKLK